MWSFLCFCFVGDKLYTYRDLGYVKPVTDVTFHPQDNFIAFGCYGEGGHPICIYSYDPKGTVIFKIFTMSFCFFILGEANVMGLLNRMLTQWVITCSKLAIETLEQGVKYVQS